MVVDLSREETVFPQKISAPESGSNRRYFLIADDSEADRLLLRRAMEENHIDQEVRFVNSGMELVDLLNQNTGLLFSSPPDLPCLIFLDLYMPRLDGHQALKIIKDDIRFKKIPVIILSNSSSLDDIARSYNDGANSFLTKPLEYVDLVRLIGSVKDYWLEKVRLPA